MIIDNTRKDNTESYRKAYKMTPAAPEPAMTHKGFAFVFLKTHRPAVKIITAMISIERRLLGRRLCPYRAIVRREKSAEAIMAITAGRSPARPPWTVSNPRKR